MTAAPAVEMPPVTDEERHTLSGRALQRVRELTGMDVAYINHFVDGRQHIERVAAHEGTLTCSSAVGEGTTSTVRLPARTAHEHGSRR